MTVQFFSNLKIHPTFHSEERLVNLVRRREFFAGLSILLVYGVDPVYTVQYDCRIVHCEPGTAAWTLPLSHHCTITGGLIHTVEEG